MFLESGGNLKQFGLKQVSNWSKTGNPPPKRMETILLRIGPNPGLPIPSFPWGPVGHLWLVDQFASLGFAVNPQPPDQFAKQRNLFWSS